MAKKTTKSSFLARVTEAHEVHKGDETRVGSGGDLPGGIEQGIARLVSAKIGVYQSGPNEGEPFFMAAGTVLDPETVTVVDAKTKKSRVIHIRGLRTQVGPEPLCDTKTQAGKDVSLADHWDRVLNWLRLLGIDTKDIEPTDVITEESEGVFGTGPILEALTEAGPTFRFRTWTSKPTEQYPDPKVNHEWRGVCQWDGDAAEGGVEDDTEAEPEWESDAAAEEEATSPPKKTAKKAAKPEPEPEVEEEVEEAAEEEEEATEEIDFAALGKLADTKKKGAQEATRVLAGHAKLLNIDHEAFKTWVEVAEAIVNHSEEEEVEEEVEEEEVEEETEEAWVPEKGELVFYMPVGAKKAVEAQVVSVDDDKAVIKRLDTKKAVKVPLEKLSATETPF